MREFFASYFDLILKERFWSWTLVGIVYLVFAFLLRAWFLGSMVQRAKELPPRYYHDVKHSYLRKSFWGWFFFFLPVILLTTVWNQAENMPPQGLYLLLSILAAVSMVWSIMIHMRAFSEAATLVLKRVLDEQEIQSVGRVTPQNSKRSK